MRISRNHARCSDTIRTRRLRRGCRSLCSGSSGKGEGSWRSGRAAFFTCRPYGPWFQSTPEAIDMPRLRRSHARRLLRGGQRLSGAGVLVRISELNQAEGLPGYGEGEGQRKSADQATGAGPFPTEEQVDQIGARTERQRTPPGLVDFAIVAKNE